MTVSRHKVVVATMLLDVPLAPLNKAIMEAVGPAIMPEAAAAAVEELEGLEREEVIFINCYITYPDVL